MQDFPIKYVKYLIGYCFTIVHPDMLPTKFQIGQQTFGSDSFVGFLYVRKGITIS